MFIHICGLWVAMLGLAECRLPSLAIEAQRYAEAGEYERAIDAWSTILTFAPEQAEFWYKRGMAHGRLGHSEAMHQDMARGSKLYPVTAWDKLRFIARYDEEDDADTVLALYEIAIQDHPSCTMVLTTYARQLALQDRIKEAMALLDRSIRLQPRNNRAYALRSTLLAATGKFDEAEHDLCLYKAWEQEHVEWVRGMVEELKAARHAQAIKQQPSVELSGQEHKSLFANWERTIEQNTGLKLSDDVVLFKTCSVEIPITMTVLARQEAAFLILYTSTTHGKVWTKVATAKPSDERFYYVAPADGLYWFSVQLVTARGNAVPANITDLQPRIKIRICATLSEKKSQVLSGSYPSQNMAIPLSMLPPNKPKE